MPGPFISLGDFVSLGQPRKKVSSILAANNHSFHLSQNLPIELVALRCRGHFNVEIQGMVAFPRVVLPLFLHISRLFHITNRLHIPED